MNVGSVEVLLQLRDLLSQQMATAVGKSTAQLAKLSNEVRKTELAIDKIGRANERSSSSFSNLGAQIGRTLLHVAAAGAAYKALGLAISSVTDQVEFTRTLTKIANVTDVTTAELAKFKSELAGLSQATGRGPQELAEGFYFIASNGFKGAEATEVLAQAAKLAAIGLGETNTIAKSLAGAINAYGKENLTAAQAADQLLAAVRAGGAEASEVAGTFGRVVAIAHELGISYAEVAASVATFTRVGVHADEAVTALRGTMAALLNPSKSAEKAIAALHDAGLSAASSMAELRAEVKERGLAVVLIDLVKATKGNEEALQDIIPNVRALAGVLANAGSQADAYKQILDEVIKSHGETDRAMENTRQSVSFMWDEVKAQAESLKLTFGEALLPGVLKFGQALNDISPDTIKRVGANLATLIGLLAQATQATVNFLDAMSKGFNAVRQLVPGDLDFGKLFREGTAYFNNFLTFSERANKSMADMATATERAGEAQSRLLNVKQGGSITFTVYQQLKKDVDAATAAITELAHTRDSLKVGDTFKGGTIVDVNQLKAARAEIQQQIDVEVRRRNALKETVQVASENNRITRDATAAFTQLAGATARLPPLPNAEAAVFAQRMGEVTQRLNDQLAAAKADLEVARQRQVQGKEALANARELSLAARTQLEINKVIAGLESDKHRLTAPQRAAIIAVVTETMRLRDEIKKVNEETARAAIGWAHGDNLIKSMAAGAALLAKNLGEAGKASSKVQLFSKVGDDGSKVGGPKKQVDEFVKEWNRGWATYADYARQAAEAASGYLKNAIVDWATGTKNAWSQLWDNLKKTALSIFLDMLEQMLRRWIATQAAMAATDYSSKSGGAGFKNVGKGGGASGYAGQAASGYQAYSGSGASAGTLAGWAVAAFALYVVYKGFVEDHKRQFASISVGETGQIVASAQHTKKYMKGVQDAVASLLTNLKQWMKDVNVQLTSFGAISIESNEGGFQVRGPNGWQQSFKTAEEAISAAQALMIRFGEFAEGVPPLVQAAIRSINYLPDFNMDELTRRVSFVRTLLTQNMEQVASAMADATQLFIDQIHESFDIFANSNQRLSQMDLTALGQATESAILRFSTSLQELYNQLTGHKDDPKEAAERQRVAYNAQRAITIAQITLLYEEIKARIALLQTQIAALTVLRQLGVGGGTGAGGGSGGAGGGGGIGTGNWGNGFGGDWNNMFKGGGAYVEQTPDERNPTNDPQLAALLQILDNLARALQGLPPEIAPGGVKPGHGGGGRGGQREQARDFLKDRQFQFALSSMDELHARLAQINHDYQAQIEAAGRDAALRQQLIDLRDQETAAAIAAFQKETEARYDDLVGNTNAFTQLHDRFEDVRKAVQAAGYGATKTAEMLAKLTEAERDAAAVLGQQMLGELLSGLAGYIEDATIKQELLKDAAIIKFNLEMANFRAQFELLKAQGLLTRSQIESVQAAFDYINNHQPNFDTPPAPGDDTSGGGGGGNGYWQIRDGHWIWVPIDQSSDNSAENARALLARYQSEGLDRWHQALQKLNADFDLIRQALGNTPEVAQAYADALARLREQFLAGLHDFYDRLTTGDLSGGGVRLQFQAAQANYRRLLALVQGGDLSQADALQHAAEQYLALAGQMFDTSTLGYQNIRQQIIQQIGDLLGIGTGNVIGGPQWFAQGTAQTVAALGSIGTTATAQVAATANVASVVDIASRRQEALLVEIRDELSVLVDMGNDATASAVSNAFAVGDDLGPAPVFRRRKPVRRR